MWTGIQLRIRLAPISKIRGNDRSSLFYWLGVNTLSETIINIHYPGKLDWTILETMTQGGDIQGDTMWGMWWPGAVKWGLQPRRYIKERSKQTETKPNRSFFQYLRTLLGQLMKFLLSTSNKTTDQLIPGATWRQGVALDNSQLIYCDLSYIHLLVTGGCKRTSPGISASSSH